MSDTALGYLMCHLTVTLMSFGLDLAWLIRGNADESDIAAIKEKYDRTITLLEQLKSMAESRDA